MRGKVVVPVYCKGGGCADGIRFDAEAFARAMFGLLIYFKSDRSSFTVSKYKVNPAGDLVYVCDLPMTPEMSKNNNWKPIMLDTGKGRTYANGFYAVLL